MNVHDARVAPVNRYYGDVKSDFGDAVIIANAGFFDTTWSEPADEPPYAGQVKGICVEGGAQVLHSRTMGITPPTDPHWQVMGWVGQEALPSTDWLYGAPRVEPAVGGAVDSAVGGLVAYYPEYDNPSGTPWTIADIVANSGSGSYSPNVTKTHIMGWSDSDSDVLYFAASKSGNGSYSPNLNFAGLVQDLVDSGAAVVFGLDGSSSIALLHRNRLGNSLDLRGTSGGRHWAGVTWGIPIPGVYDKGHRVSTYMIIKWKP